MNFKNYAVVFAIVICMFLSLSCAAAEDAGDVNMTASEDQQIGEAQEDIISQSPEDLISANDSVSVEKGSFSELQGIINAAPAGSTVTLTRNYKYDDGFNEGQGILIAKDLTIDGNGHTLNGMSKSRILFIVPGLVKDFKITLKDITFTNGFTRLYGGAICNFGDLTVENCVFRNNFANTTAGAICSVGMLDCKKSTFSNNKANGDAGAIFSLNFKGSSAIFGEYFKKLIPSDLSSFDFSGINLSKINWDAFDFSSLDFSKIDLSKINLSAIDWSAIDLGKINLSSIDLKSIDLSSFGITSNDLKAIVLKALLTNKLDLSRFGLGTVDLSKIDLSPIGLDSNTVKTIVLKALLFKTLDLTSLGLGTIDLTNVNFKSLDLSSLDLRSLVLKYINLSSIDVSSIISDLTGGISLTAGTDYIRNCKFSNNVAAGYGGGAVYAFTHIKILSSEFKSNKVEKMGGAVFANKNLYLKNCKFTRNQAAKYGGAVYFRYHELSGFYDKNGHWKSEVKYYSNTIEKCTFTENAAKQRGGALYGFKYSGKPKVLPVKAVKCTFSDNVAADGNEVYGGSLKNCVLKNTKVTLKKVTVRKSASKLVLTATLKKASKALKSKKIVFNFNGKKYYGTTNSKGVAKVTIKSSALRKLIAGMQTTYKATYKGIYEFSDSVTVKVKA